MLIMTANKYLKIGLESLTGQVACHPSQNVVIFDAGENIYLLQEILPIHLDDRPTNLFSVLTSGKRIRKSEIKTPEHFYQYLIECQRNKSSYETKRQLGMLTLCEEGVILELCTGYTITEIAAKLNKSLKTVSSQKITALRKLGMRNMQCLHRMFIHWNAALKNTSTFPYKQDPYIWKNQISVSSQYLI